jgi:hypothetical protein
VRPVIVLAQILASPVIRAIDFKGIGKRSKKVEPIRLVNTHTGF